MTYIIIFIIALFANANANVDTNTNVEIDYSYYEYKNVRDSSNNFFNLRITYEMCDEINNSNESRYMCKMHAYERAISIDA